MVGSDDDIQQHILLYTYTITINICMCILCIVYLSAQNPVVIYVMIRIYEEGCILYFYWYYMYVFYLKYSILPVVSYLPENMCMVVIYHICTIILLLLCWYSWY